MAKLNITQAAREWGVARSTLQRAIKSGRISIHQENGSKYIDSSEMIRVYGEASASSRSTLGAAQDILEIENESLKKQIRTLERLVDSQEKNLERQESVIANQREMLTAFFKRLRPPKKTS